VRNLGGFRTIVTGEDDKRVLGTHRVFVDPLQQ